MTANVDNIKKMQHTWKTQAKPHIEDLMSKENGHFRTLYGRGGVAW